MITFGGSDRWPTTVNACSVTSWPRPQPRR